MAHLDRLWAVAWCLVMIAEEHKLFSLFFVLTADRKSKRLWSCVHDVACKSARMRVTHHLCVFSRVGKPLPLNLAWRVFGNSLPLTAIVPLLDVVQPGVQGVNPDPSTLVGPPLLQTLRVAMSALLLCKPHYVSSLIPRRLVPICFRGGMCNGCASRVGA